MKIDRHQYGAVTLLMSLVILLALTTIVFTGAKSARMEQLVSANERRSLEVFHAAEAGLEDGIRWLDGIQPAWTTTAVSNCSQTYVRTSSLTVGSDSFNLTITYCRNAASTSTRQFVQVTSQAVSAQDATVTATVRQYVRPNSIMTKGYLSGAPPIVVNGCIGGDGKNSSITGTPDVYPGEPGDVVVLSNENTSCLRTGHLDLNQGTIGTADFAVTWEYLFGPALTTNDVKLRAATEVTNQVPFAQRSYFWTDSTNPLPATFGNNVQWGSPDHPVIIVFAKSPDATNHNCSQINGSPVIYGIIYFEDTDCGNQGWGGAHIYGTAAFEGPLTQFNANAWIKNFGLAGNGTDLETTLPYNGIPKVLGTWKDF
ncbi:MAG: hypothetical protein H7836_06295 [Magnetococcus sp. YQC-3]